MAFGDFTVVRASQKRVLGSSGTLVTYANNEPAFEFNADGTYKGLLVEPAATNLLTYSEQFDNAAWTKINASVTANATASPDGATTADKVIPTAVNDAHSVVSGPLNTGGLGTFSVFAKASELSRVGIRESTTTGAYANFNLNTGAVIDSGSGAVNVVIEEYPSGWYRLSLGFNTASNVNFAIFPLDDSFVSGNPNSYAWTGDGTSGIYIWGAQLETGSVATSYIPTVASTANRAADDISLSSASSLIGQTEGTIYWQMKKFNPSAGLNGIRLLVYSDANNIILISPYGTTIRILVLIGGVAHDNFYVISGDDLKIAVAYKANDWNVYVNGTSVGIPAIASVPAMSAIGWLDSPGVPPDTKCNNLALALFPTRLSNAQLQALTTL